MSKREWIKPVYTEGVTKFGEQPMRWVFEAKPRQVYYCVEIYPEGDAHRAKLLKIDMPAPIEGPQGELGYITSMFKMGDGNVQVLESLQTSAARRTVIELRKRVLLYVKIHRGLGAANQDDTLSIPSPLQTALEPPQTAYVGG